MKKLLLAVFVAALTTACSSQSAAPSAPSATAVASPVMTETVVWGSVTGNNLCHDQLSVDTGSLGNPSPKGSDVTGAINTNCIAGAARVFSLSYGSVSSGPASVTLPANATTVTFTIHTTGSGTDAHITSSTAGSTVSAHVVGATVVWGS